MLGAHVAHGIDKTSKGNLHLHLATLYNSLLSGHSGSRRKDHEMKEDGWT